jgi:hypothetical protein
LRKAAELAIKEFDFLALADLAPTLILSVQVALVQCQAAEILFAGSESNALIEAIFRDLQSWLIIVSIGVAVLAAVGVLGWRFRRSVDSSMRKAAAESTPAEPRLTTAQASSTLVPLVLRRLEVTEVGLAPGQAATALSEADATARGARFAYAAAGLAFVAVTTFVLTLGMGPMFRKWPPYAQFLLVCLQQWPALFILVWFLGISLPTRLAIFGGYLLLGLLALPIGLGLLGLPIGPNFLSAATAAATLSQYTALLPMAALLFLLARPLRPWLIGVFAILIFVVTEMALATLFRLYRLDMDMSGMKTAWVVAGIMFEVTAVVFVGWVLRRGSWHLPVGALALLSAMGLLIFWLLPDYKVGPFHLAPLLIGLPVNVLQVFVVWLLFKLFMRLQERQFLPAQILHSHLCWGFITIYLFLGLTYYLGQWWTPWMVLLAYALYLAVLHVVLRRIWALRLSSPGKRLLLLRVFGRADKREKLLDALDDTWRRIGRIDLIAGTDLATRTMGSLMLEAFLLRRTDDQFLKTDEDVNRRLEHLHAQLEGDARYPVNGIYCYATAWQQAVAHLAPKSDAVLMDLRGFTRKNQGCVFELTWVVQQILLSRIILLIDATTDYQALEKIVQAAWTHLRSDSPNASYLEPVLTILNTPLRSKGSRRALFMLLLRATYHVEA